MELLSKLFGSEARVKIMRLFLFNPRQPFSAAETAKRAKCQRRVARRELNALKQAKLIESKSFTQITEKKKGKKVVKKKKRQSGFILNGNFPFLSPLQNLLLYTVLVKNDSLVRRINKTGKIRLIVIGGVLIQNWDSRLDLLVVGDRLRPRPLETVVKGLEAEIGTELKYASFSTEDFRYRYGMYDKLIRDVLDYPHKTLVDKMGLGES